MLTHFITTRPAATTSPWDFLPARISPLGGNNIDVGNAGVAAESNTIRIGTAQIATFIAGIRGRSAPGGLGVVVAANGKLGTVASSRRFKEGVKPMDKDSEAILALKPVTFRYKQEFDPEGIPQFGLVAEEVEKVNPALVARDEKGKAYTVRYEAVNAMLLNEFLKEHRKGEDQDSKIQEQEATITEVKSAVAKQERIIAQQQKEIMALTAGVKKQAALIQKVSAQVITISPALQLVDNQSKLWTTSTESYR